MLDRIEAGFAGLNVAADSKNAALAALRRWIEEPQFADDRPQLEALVNRGAWDLLLDSFYQVIPFGTGGRRGPVGLGPNRFNLYTLSTSVQGHADWMRDRFEGPLSVTIAYDVRVYRDRNGIYDPLRPNPVLGISSRDFAELAARVYTANGVKVWLQRRGDPRYMSTPELSFAIRCFHTSAGLNVSASHNPPDDNGGKFYNDRGGQEIAPNDEAMVDRVANVKEVKLLSWQKAKDSGLLMTLGEDVHEAYIDHVAGKSRTPSRSARVVFTGLHGTGSGTVVEVLRKTGFQVSEVLSQKAPDGDFPTVPFRAPNPEVPRSMDIAVAQATAEGADLVLATDPDADRIGGNFRHQGGWRFLNGNEIGTLVIHHALTHWNGKSPPIVMQTEVTSGFIARMSRAMGAKVVDHLLVGFKYIGAGLAELEDTGRFAGIEGAVDDFAGGVEESHGVLITPAMRDKDAAGGGLYLAEAASLAKDQGRSVIDVLEDLWRTYGYVGNRLISTVMRGAVGRGRIQEIQDSFRNDPPKQIGGRTITAFHDRRDPKGVFGPIKSATDAASRDVLVFELGDEARVILRPSGTEPKNKAYVEVRGRQGVTDLEAEKARVDAEAMRLAESFVDVMLGRVGMSWPDWAHGIDDLVPVEQKLRFAKEILPELVRRVGAGEPVDPWLDQQLAPLGKDPRKLVDRAVKRWSDGSPLAQKVVALFA
jgi:phosphoglucomutase